MRFSIIIPVYNAEATLDACLSGIVAQGYSDYQVLIVDDGSTDGSTAVARAFARRDSRFVLLSIEHSGPGAARNAGLAHAEGDYVVYLDADDYWIREDLLQELDNRIIAQPADVYMYQMVKVTETGAVLNRYTKPPFAKADVAVELKDVYQDLVSDGHTLASACNKCVRRALLQEKQIWFRADIMGEDIDWVLQLFSYAKTICLVNLQAYAYVQHKVKTRSTRFDAHNDLASIVHSWGLRSKEGTTAHAEAVAGLVAFQYAICLGHDHLLSSEMKATMRRDTYLLNYGLDKKTKLIRRFFRTFGYTLTAASIRLYLTLRRIW